MRNSQGSARSEPLALIILLLGCIWYIRHWWQERWPLEFRLAYVAMKATPAAWLLPHYESSGTQPFAQDAHLAHHEVHGRRATA
jgi:hypothetical protein